VGTHLLHQLDNNKVCGFPSSIGRQLGANPASMAAGLQTPEPSAL
jgi:hypothetical protein